MANNIDLSKKTLLSAALGNRSDRVPVWFMRQAGRYLPEYRKVRETADFLKMCHTPSIAAEVTLQPLRRFDLDGAIIFADILLPCTVLGQTLTFDEGHGPRLNQAIRTADQVAQIRVPNHANDLAFVGEAIAKTKSALKPHQTMIGFAGAPFTVASYMVEGQGSKNFTEVRRLMYHEPRAFTSLLEKLAEYTVHYLEMQVQAGAEIVMLFDSWACEISSIDYFKMVAPVLKTLEKSLRKFNVPLIFFPGQGSDNLWTLKDMSWDVVSIDWRIPLNRAADMFRAQGQEPTLQGNLDPQVLIGPEALIREKVRAVLEDAKKARAHIFNVGHGLLPHTPPESLNIVIDEIRKTS